MKDEIKEILNKLKDINNFDYSEELDNEGNLLNKSYDIYLSKEETDTLLDYITNLQEELEEEKRIEENDLHKIQQLEEDFRILKELQMKTNKENQRLKEKYDKALNDLVKESHKNMKAIEYIKHLDNVFIDDKKQDEILNILEGEDKDE